MKFFAQLFLFTFILASCNYELDNIDPPDNLIPKDTFALILKDLMLLESQVKVKNSNVHTFYQWMPSSANVVFKQHKTDSARFNSSMRYYSSKQSLMSDIYIAIQDEVEQESAHFREEEEYQVVGDSATALE
jgi:hypothetical protein